MKIFLILIYLFASTFGLIMIKLGSSSVALKLNKVGLEGTFSWNLLIGLLSYIISFVLWVFVISKYDLSYIYPIVTAILYIVIMFASVIFLKETVSHFQIIGVIIIMVGVIIASIK